MNKIKIAAVIPVKEKSKRLPGKNLKNLAGKPMMAYIIETVKKIRAIDRVIVSTESPKVARVARKYGAEAPFMRPVALTRDQVTTHEVLLHAVRELEKQGYVPDYVLLLYATSPLLKKDRIEEAVKLVLEKGSDSVVSGTYDKGHYWEKVEGGWVRVYPKFLKNSQFQDPLFKEDGAIYMTKTSILKKQIVADKIDIVFMEPGENIDVDYPEDFKKVEETIQKRKR